MAPEPGLSWRIGPAGVQPAPGWGSAELGARRAPSQLHGPRKPGGARQAVMASREAARMPSAGQSCAAERTVELKTCGW